VTYLRKRQLAARYGVHVRTIDRMVDDGRLPRPDIFMGKLPMWSDETIAANERRATTERQPPNPIAQEAAAAARNGEHA